MFMFVKQVFYLQYFTSYFGKISADLKCPHWFNPCNVGNGGMDVFNLTVCAR